MNTLDQQPASNDTSSNQSRGCCSPGGRGRRGGALVVLLAALVAGAAGGYIGKTYAQGSFGGPMGGRMGMHGTIDPAKLDTQVERMIKHFAVEVDATPAQRDKLTVIAKAVAKDLLPMRAQMRSAREQATGLIGGANVDRAALEILRAAQITMADTASRRMTQALADAAEVLTPEQREKIAAHMKERGGRGAFWHRG